MRKAFGLGLVALCALTVPMITGDARQALAGSHHYDSSKVNYAASHQSVIKIRHSDRLPQTKGIRLGRNKSVLIELPSELRDVVVSDPTIMDAVVQSSNRVYLIGKKIGQSNAFFFDSYGQQILTLEVSIEQDVSVLDSLFRRLIPGSNIKSEMLNDTVILTGNVNNPADSTRASQIASRFIMATPASNGVAKEKVINLLAVDGEEQVMLKVTVAEVQRTLMKQLGINLGAVVGSGNFLTSVLTDNALPLTAAAGLGTLPVAGVLGGALDVFNAGPTATSGEGTFGNSGVAGAWNSGRNSLTYGLRALERDGLIRTLAEPNLTAISGESAKFLAGGEYPIPVVDSSGALSVTFKEFGISVAFTPVVMSEGRISLKIETEVSELTNAGAVTLSNISIPALKKRSAKSTVELPSGGTIVMAGLISEDTRQNIDGLPGLKNLPILGTLFRSRDFIKNETELVVMVTPYLVKPTARKKLARPDDGFAAPSDREGVFLGHLNKVYGRGKSLPTGGLKGDYGFIVE